MERLLREEGRRHEGEGGILGTADLHLAPETLPASNHRLVHRPLRANEKPKTDNRQPVRLHHRPVFHCPLSVLHSARRRATTTRGRPARSRRTQAGSPSARSRHQRLDRLGLLRADLQQQEAARTDSARGWSRRFRAATRRPSAPPSRASRGSHCTSGMSVTSSLVGMYGGFATTRSADPSGTCPSTARQRSPRRKVIRSATPCRSALARATRSARHETSVARMRAVGSSVARATATAPEPVHSSTIVGPASGPRRLALGAWRLALGGVHSALALGTHLAPGGQRGLDQSLGLGTRHQDPGRDGEGQRPELPRSEDVSQWLALLAALEQPEGLTEFLHGKTPVRLQPELPAGAAEDGGQQALRVQPRRFDSGLFQ